MGLAASQARLLLLTARRSDLEFRAQMITQQKLALATETEQIATAYSEALGDQKLVFNWGMDPNTGAMKKEDLSYNSIIAGSEVDYRKYRIRDCNGNIICASEADLTAEQKVGGNIIEDPSVKDNAVLAAKLQSGEWVIETNDRIKLPPIKYENADGVEMTAAEYNAQLKIIKDGTAEGASPEAEAAVQGARDKIAGFAGVPNYFDNWNAKSWDAMSEITKELNTKNDAYASGVYQRKTAEIQQKDKLLDVQLKQIETQLEAVKSEQESVKSLIKDRAGKDFKTFG